MRGFDIESLQQLTESHYHLQQVISSPLDYAIPVNRCRSYALLTLKSRIVCDIQFARSTVEELMFRKVACNARVFFRAPSSLVNAYFEQNMRPERAQESDETPARKTLSIAALNRLDEHLFSQMATGARFCCVAYNQRCAWMQFNAMIPALTTSTTLWGADLEVDDDDDDERHGDEGTTSKSASGSRMQSSKSSPQQRIDRPLLPAELLAVQGWPVLLPANSPFTERLPEPFKFKSLQRSTSLDLRRLAGNSMHVVQIGAALAFAMLATHEK